MLENFKRKIQDRIERNAVESTLVWRDKNGMQHSEDVILKKSKIPVIGDWSRIYPVTYENADGEVKVHWINLIFGGRKNFIKVLIILAIVFMVLWQFSENFAYIEALKAQPCYAINLTNSIP
jgi:hypothetical protein